MIYTFYSWEPEFFSHKKQLVLQPFNGVKDNAIGVIDIEHIENSAMRFFESFCNPSKGTSLAVLWLSYFHNF